MPFHPPLRRLCRLALLLLLFALLAPAYHTTAADYSPFVPEQATESLPAIGEVEPNDTLDLAGQGTFGTGATQPQWQQEATGRISAPGDLDWYALAVERPASALLIDLVNLPADYDLVLAQGRVGATGDDGLTEIVDIGGRIGAIGGRIGAIGGRIGAIGGRIGAIGGRIGAIGGRIGAISVGRDRSDERIDTTAWQPGTYYIAVVGSNGAASEQPYTLRVSLAGSSLQNAPAPHPVLLTRPNDPSITTLFLLSTSRLRQRYPDTSSLSAIASIRSALTTLAGRTNGVVLDLDELNRSPAQQLIGSSETISDIYSLWDADGANPFAANRVAQTVDNLITAATVQNPSDGSGTGVPPYPNVRNIVLVGGDAVIPFYRAPDLTGFANESEYAVYLRSLDPTGVISSTSPLGAALAQRTLLTDDLYGADGSYNFPVHPLYLPDRAVGRLVEQPSEIASYLRAYEAGSLTIDTRTGGAAVVTGYDFLVDQAAQVAGTFNTLGLSRVTGLVSDTWGRTDLQRAWFDGQLDGLINPYFVAQNPFQLQSINGHFDHWQAIPATATEGALDAERILTPTNFTAITPYFANRLAYSVGCHSGLNVESAALAEVGDPGRLGADFPQAFIKQAGSWVGNTGYGYGTDSVGYSELLSLRFTEELGRDGGSGGREVGAALVAAKQRYVRDASRLDGFDAKVLMQWTLYGLPFLRVLVPQPLPPLAESSPPPVLPPAATPPADGLGVVERIITFTLQFNQGQEERTGSSYPLLQSVAVDDSFVRAGAAPQEARIGQLDQAGLPTLPQFAYPLSGRSGLNGSAPLAVQGVQMVGSSFATVGDYNPQITQIVTQDFDLLPAGAEPPFDAGTGVWFPDAFFALSSTEGAGAYYDQLLVTAAQFRAAAGGVRGEMRTYTTLTLRVTYIDPGATQAPAALADTTPPTIERVAAAPAGNTSSRVAVAASDFGAAASGVDAVLVSYSDGSGAWRSVTLDPADAGQWAGVVPVAIGSAQLLVSARDRAGNVATFTGKGQYGAAAEPARVLLPFVTR